MTNQVAWQEIIDQHGAAVLQVAFRILGNVHDAEDVTQEVLLEAFKGACVPEVGLLRRMASFRAIDRLRARAPTVGFDETLHAGSMATTELAAEVAERVDRLRGAIARLPKRQARCFWLRYVDGMSNRQIAEALSISPSAVSTALNKARSSLRHTISKHCGSYHD